MELEKVIETLSKLNTLNVMGKVKNIVGMMIESSSFQARVGDICMIRNLNDAKTVMAEVIGFRNGNILLMAYGEVKGIGPGSLVQSTEHKLRIPVGDFLAGRIIGATGEPIDGLSEFHADEYYDVDSPYTNPLERPRINTCLSFGIKAIDGLLTIGKGQRMGIFSGSGVGKSTLMGMIAKNVKADINVIALVGERGRELSEFIEKDLGKEGLKRSVVVVATSDQPAMFRVKCAAVATTIAEYFRDQGNDVLLMMDSLTRFAMAQREIGLSAGEPPIARGYTPSIYAELPKLLERSGNFKSGSITGIYTVLVEGDDTNEPIADTVRGILDGHIVLSRSLAQKSHYPAIDIGASISRLMSDIVTDEHKQAAAKIRNWLSIYNQNQDLISIGAYKSGMNYRLDEAVKKIDAVNEFLCQKVNESFTFEKTVEMMKEL